MRYLNPPCWWHDEPPQSWYDPPTEHHEECNCENCHEIHMDTGAFILNAKKGVFECCEIDYQKMKQGIES